MINMLHGKVHGRTIQLDEDPGVADGQAVEVQMKIIQTSNRKPGEGFSRTEGALADDQEWDGIMEEIYKSRKLDSRKIPDLVDPWTC